MKNKAEVEEILVKFFGSTARQGFWAFFSTNLNRLSINERFCLKPVFRSKPFRENLTILWNLKIVKKREATNRVYYQINTLSSFF